MHKKHHEKFKILDILDVTTQAREGIETRGRVRLWSLKLVTTQAREGIETHPVRCGTLHAVQVTTQAREGIETERHLPLRAVCKVTTQAREGIETCNPVNSVSKYRCNNSSP